MSNIDVTGIIETNPVQSNPTTASVRDNFAAIKTQLSTAKTELGNLSGVTDQATARSNIGAVIGTNVQAYDATLQSLSALGTAADKIPYTTGVDTWAETPLTSFARTLLDDADAGAAMQTLNGVQVVTTVATLRTIAPNTSRKIWLAYHTTTGDGGHGMFRAVTGAAPGTYVDNGGTIIVPTGGDGSAAWLREYSGAINARWFGAHPSASATTNTTAFNNAAAYAASVATGMEIRVPAGSYALNGPIAWNGGSSFVSWVGDGSNQTTLSWSTVNHGFSAGATTAVGKVAISGMTLYQGAVATNCAAIYIVSDGGSPLSVNIEDVIAFGGAIGGTPANGYWGSGAVYLLNPVYPILKDVYHFGIGGTPSVANNALITAGFTIVENSASGSSLFTNMQNCFGNGSNYGAYFATQSTPGIEGVFMDGCNFNSCNTGIRAEAPAGDYYPPQYVIDKCQIEFLQVGISLYHIAVVNIADTLLYADPTADVADIGINANSCNEINIHDCIIEARPIHTAMEGIIIDGASTYANIRDNDLKTPIPAVVFAGTASYCKQHGNIQRGAGALFTDTSTNAALNHGATTFAMVGETFSSDGVCEKWGAANVTLTTGGDFSYTFATAFKNACYTVVACNGNSDAGAEPCNLLTYSTTGFTGRFPGGTASTQRQVNFIAKGR